MRLTGDQLTDVAIYLDGKRVDTVIKEVDDTAGYVILLDFFKGKWDWVKKHGVVRILFEVGLMRVR